GLAWMLCIIAILLVGFVTKTTEMFSRQVMLLWVPAAFVMQIINHVCIGIAIKRYKETFGKHLKVLVVGDGSTARHLIQNLNGNRWLPDRVVGVVRGNGEAPDIAMAATLPVPI
ncbi:hypothetical protein, partial [Staphylococcus pasteuri_A]